MSIDCRDVGVRERERPARRKQRVALGATLSAVVMMVVSLAAPPASAHAGDQSYLYLDVGQTLTARLQMPFVDVAEGLGIQIDGTEPAIADKIEANEAPLRAYAEQHFDVGSDGVIFAKEFLQVSRFADTDYVEVAFTMVGGADADGQLEVRLDPFFDEIEGRDALLLIANDWNRGVVDNEDEHLLRFDSGSRQQSFQLGNSSSWTNFTTSVGTGVDHIRTGPDHMLFVFALVLPAVLVWRERWVPATSFRSSLWRVAKMMTMFTIAHSVTFSLAGIGLVPTPSARVTETMIAASIVATALHNLRPVFRDREGWIVFAFGLFHGFGFASLVQSLDVSTKTQLVSLAGRNVGIEIGQLVVVLLVFPALFLLRLTKAYMPIFRVACGLLAVAGIGWMLERLFGFPRLTSIVLNRVLAIPAILVLLAAGTVGAVYWRVREQRADRLLALSAV